MRPNQRPTIEELYAAYGNDLYRYCFRLCHGNEADAQDLAQETWVRAHQGLESFKGDATVRTWLYRIALNTRLKRRQKRSNSMESLKDLETEGGSEDPRSNQLVRLWLDSGLAALPEALYQALILVKAEGMTHKEAAAVLGLPQGTVQYQVHEAIKRLRKLLSDDPRSPYLGALVPLTVLETELPRWGDVATPPAISASILEELRRLSPEALPPGNSTTSGAGQVRGSGRMEAPNSAVPRPLLDRRAVIAGSGLIALLAGFSFINHFRTPPEIREVRTWLKAMRDVGSARAWGTTVNAVRATAPRGAAKRPVMFTYSEPAQLRQNLLSSEVGPAAPSEVIILNGSEVQRRNWVGRHMVGPPPLSSEQAREEFAAFDYFSPHGPLAQALAAPNVEVTVESDEAGSPASRTIRVVQREDRRARRWTLHLEPGTRRLVRAEYVFETRRGTDWQASQYVLLDRWDYGAAFSDTDFQLPPHPSSSGE